MLTVEKKTQQNPKLLKSYHCWRRGHCGTGCVNALAGHFTRPGGPGEQSDSAGPWGSYLAPTGAPLSAADSHSRTGLLGGPTSPNTFSCTIMGSTPGVFLGPSNPQVKKTTYSTSHKNSSLIYIFNIKIVQLLKTHHHNNTKVNSLHSSNRPPRPPLFPWHTQKTGIFESYF